MARKDSLLKTTFLLVIGVALRVQAQVVETPIPFDSAGKIRSVTPAMAQRFSLAAPEWPVRGGFVDVRLFAVSTGGSVLVAERPDGQLERYTLTDDQRDTLRAAIDRAVASTGRVVSEVAPRSVSQPARTAFVRNQMILSAVMYGPLIASLANDGRTATALYLLSVGGSFFALSNLPKSMVVTRAQNRLASDGGLRGYGIAAGILTSIAGTNVHYKTYNGVGLAGAIGMSVIGFNRGRGMTDAEAEATAGISTLTGLGALGILGSAGQLDDGDRRVNAALITASGIAGYVAGPMYPRRASYTVTTGDVQTLPLGLILGAATGLAPFAEFSGEDERPLFAAATAAGAVGVVLADRLLAKPFDYGLGDVTQLWLGTIAGALVGGAVVVMTEPARVAAWSMVTGGGILGAVAGHRLADPPPGTRRTGSTGWNSRHVGKARLRLEPIGLALSATQMRGQHALLTLSF